MNTPHLTPEMKAKLSSQDWRLDNLYWIVDANKTRVRFRMNDPQRELYHNLWYRTIIPKSRRHGVTTFFGVFMLDQCLFVPNIRAGIIAHNEEDAEAIFRDKVKYPYDELPPEIKALRPAKTDRKRELLFSNNSSIRVIPSGRSGTYNLMHISEFGRICLTHPAHAQEIVAGGIEAVGLGNYVFIESTAHGRIGQFYDFCQAAHALQLSGREPSELDFMLHFIPWWRKAENVLEPRLVVVNARMQEYFVTLRTKFGIHLTHAQQAWYAKKEEALGADMKSEHPSTYEECFEQTLEGTYYASQFRYLRENQRIGPVPYSPGHQVDTWWDLGMNDMNVIWFSQNIGREIHFIDYYENHGEGLPHYATILDKKGYRYGRHVAPFDINVKELGSGKTRIQSALELGIKFDVAPQLSVLDGIEAVRKLMPLCWFDEAKCEIGLRHLENYRKQWDDRIGIWKDEPLHDEASHGADAFRTFGVAHGGLLERTILAEARTTPRTVPIIHKVNMSDWTT